MKLRTWLTFIFLVSLPLLSQRYLVHHYDELQGLMNSWVNDITQDRQGRLWLATRSGIAVYDGVSWQNFSASEGLGAANFLKVRVGSDGMVWVLASSSRNRPEIFCFDGQGWQQIPPPGIGEDRDVELTSFCLFDNNGQTHLAVGTRGIGLFLKGVHDDRWKNFTVDDGLRSNAVNGMAVWQDRLYIATAKGLSTIHDGRVDNTVSRQVGLSTDPIWAVGIESADLTKTRIWLYGQGWLGYFTAGDRLWVKYPLPILFSIQRPCHSLLADYRGGIFLASQTRIYYFNYRTNRLEDFNIKSGLISEGATSLYMDDERNIWIPCYRGVSKIASRRFGSFQLQHGLLEDEVTAILEYEPGKLVFGHPGGVTFYDGREFSTLSFEVEEDADVAVSRILDIKIDSKQNIWLAVAQRGLGRIDRQRKIKWYGRERADRDFFNSLWVRRDDSIWVATGREVLTLRDGELVPLELALGIHSKFRKIYIAADGSIYLGTMAEGIYEYKNNRWRNYRCVKKPRLNSVFAITQDRRGRILIGSRGGLCTLNNGRIEKIMVDAARSDRPVFFILEDRERGLWLGTDYGVVHRDGTRQLTYTVREGLIGPETNRAAAIIDAHGVPWFGTNRGVSFYNEVYDDMKYGSVPPKVRLLCLVAGDKKRPLGGKDIISLSHREGDLVFHFRGISFVDEQGIRFKHKIEGFDTDWSAEHYPYNQIIRYQNVPPGTYRFALKARNALGAWSPVIESGLIVVHRPFYQRWWFYLLVFAALLIVAAAIQRYLSIRHRSSLLERNVAERTDLLKAAEERYSRLFKDSKDAVLIISTDGRFFDINPAGLELLGYSNKAAVFRANIFKDHFIEDRERELFRQKVADMGFVKDFELVLKRNNGMKFSALATANAVKNKQGQLVAYQGIIRDITERKRLEQQLEQTRKMKAIAALAGGVAHDLNNLLSGLINYPELLLMDIPRESPAGKTILAIQKTGEKAAAIVQDLLTLSRSGYGVHEVVNINDVVGEYLLSPEYERLKKNHPQVHFETRLAPALHNIVGSPVHLFKAVMNLVTNAAEAVQGEGRCTIITHNALLPETLSGYENIEKGEYAVLTVADDGVGISAENINRIFEPFYTTKIMGRSGTGLGMSVVWGTVKDHDGCIDVKSEVGAGTTFRLYFPVTGEQVENRKKLPSLDRFKGDEHILVVDDVKEQREIASAILRRLGYRVTALADGEAAVDYLQKEAVDLVLLDMIMNPGMDGLETYREILNVHPQQKAVIVSGYSKTSRIARAQSLGAGTFVQKPYSIEKIGAAIRKELDGSPA
jgi:PAS domain S-box-containing protein